MDLGFDTIGNATLVCHDRGPVLVTDPWLGGPAYFGSWALSHEIPVEVHESIVHAPYVWLSHGHPDHLNAGSLPLFRDKQVLLPDHVGGRIATALRKDGYHVHVLPDGEWIRLSDRIRVLCITYPSQDAGLLIDLNGRLLVNLNDANDKGSGAVKRIIRRYPISFLLRLSGFGDADMINFFDDSGQRLPCLPQIRKENGYEVGTAIARVANAFGVTHAIPFSSLHRYQRSDSVWANQWKTSVDDYPVGFSSSRCQLLPPFVRYDCVEDRWEEIAPAPVNEVVLKPEHFGDNWGEQLDRNDVRLAERYFQSFEHLPKHFDFVNLRVGGKDNVISFRRRRFHRGITFEAPRNSLMKALEYEVFDDLLIGNFMKTTLHGTSSKRYLYPDFTPYVAKYGDNGRAHTTEELRRYWSEYRRRMTPLAYVRSELERRATQVFRSKVGQDSPLYELAARAYWKVKSVSNWGRVR